MEDVKSLSDQELYSSCHLRSIFRASHSLASRTLPSLPLDFIRKHGSYIKQTSPKPERKNIEECGTYLILSPSPFF